MAKVSESKISKYEETIGDGGLGMSVRVEENGEGKSAFGRVKKNNVEVGSLAMNPKGDLVLSVSKPGELSESEFRGLFAKSADFLLEITQPADAGEVEE